MAVITTGTNPKLLWPGLKAIWGNNYQEHQMEWPQLVERDSSDKAYEEDQQVTQFGLAPIKPQGSATQYDTESQGYTTRYNHVAYSLGYIVTWEEQRDNKYEEVARRRTQGLAFSARQSKENVIANHYNRAHNSSYTGGDSKELCATDHPTLSGNQSNELATAADLSETSLEDLCIQIMDAKNDRGLNISLMPEKLIVPTDLYFEAHRILDSELRVDTANNDINVLRAQGKFPGGVVVNHYLTDTDAFFIMTNAPRGMVYFERDPIEFGQDPDFDTKNIKYRFYERYSSGWSDWRGVYSNGGGA